MQGRILRYIAEMAILSNFRLLSSSAYPRQMPNAAPSKIADYNSATLESVSKAMSQEPVLTVPKSVGIVEERAILVIE